MRVPESHHKTNLTVVDTIPALAWFNLPDGLWFLLQVEALRDKTGEVIRWYGAATDIPS
ncbi:MAG: hypothetical protein JWP08_3808 [Bryobacterales bacterium]|nr:hypothetical protein [Bryobacterales bacterium]